MARGDVPTQRSESCSAATPAPTMPRVTLALAQLRQAPRPVSSGAPSLRMSPSARRPTEPDTTWPADAFARPSAASTSRRAPSRRAKGQQQRPTGTGPCPFGRTGLIHGAQHVRAGGPPAGLAALFLRPLPLESRGARGSPRGRPRATRTIAAPEKRRCGGNIGEVAARTGTGTRADGGAIGADLGGFLFVFLMRKKQNTTSTPLHFEWKLRIMRAPADQPSQMWACSSHSRPPHQSHINVVPRSRETPIPAAAKRPAFDGSPRLSRSKKKKEAWNPAGPFASRTSRHPPA